MTDLFSSVNINTSFQRSARIDNKISKEFLNNFVFHDTSKKVLNQISSSLLNSNQSGFTLTGPYGTGKSSLALYLKGLVSKDLKIKKLAEKKSNYNSRHTFHKVFLNKKWFVLNLVGSKRDPLESIAEQIFGGSKTKKTRGLKQIKKKEVDKTKDPSAQSDRAASIIEQTRQKAMKPLLRV